MAFITGAPPTPILDRLVHNAYRIELTSESLRKNKTPKVSNFGWLTCHSAPEFSTKGTNLDPKVPVGVLISVEM